MTSDCFDWNPLIGIATGLIALFGILQYVLSRRSSQKELRAYIGIDSEDTLIKGTLVQFKIENFGKTPAYKMTCWLNWEVFSPLDATFDNTPAPNRIYSVLNPHGILHVHVNLTTEEWESAKRRMEDGVSAFYVWGEIHYDDAFGNPHWHTFRCRTEEGIRPFYTIRLCNEGNNTDRD